MPTAPPPARDAKVDAQIFWMKFHREIVAFIMLAIVAAIGYAGYRFYSAHRDSAAAELLAQAKTGPEYQQVIAQYPRTPASASASLLLGQAQRNEKRFAESNATLQAFLQKFPKHELAPPAHMTMAANLESLGRVDDALARYQQIANDWPQGYEAPYALVSQVRLLRAKNQNDQARLICEKILTEHRDSRWAGEAMRQLRELTPKESSMPSPATGAGSTSAPAGNVLAPPPLLARPSAAAPAPSAPPKPK